MRLTPTKFTDRRTKNRLREHGRQGWKVERFGFPQCFNGRPAVLCEAADGWKGWLQSEMIDMETE